jgi:hypothetical protein
MLAGKGQLDIVAAVVREFELKLQHAMDKGNQESARALTREVVSVMEPIVKVTSLRPKSLAACNWSGLSMSSAHDGIAWCVRLQRVTSSTAAMTAVVVLNPFIMLADCDVWMAFPDIALENLPLLRKVHGLMRTHSAPLGENPHLISKGLVAALYANAMSDPAHVEEAIRIVRVRQLALLFRSPCLSCCTLVQEDLKKPAGTDVTPSAVVARRTLACGLGNTGRLAECKEVFEPLLKLPGWVHCSMCRCCEYMRAESVCVHACMCMCRRSLFDMRSDIHHKYAMILTHHRQPDAAIEQFDAARKHGCPLQAVVTQLAVAYAWKGDEKRSNEYAEKAAEIFGGGRHGRPLPAPHIRVDCDGLVCRCGRASEPDGDALAADSSADDAQSGCFRGQQGWRGHQEPD